MTSTKNNFRTRTFTAVAGRTFYTLDIIRFSGDILEKKTEKHRTPFWGIEHTEFDSYEKDRNCTRVKLTTLPHRNKTCRLPIQPVVHLHVPGGVVLGTVERLEAVVVVFYLRCILHPVDQGVPHIYEDVGGQLRHD